MKRCASCGKEYPDQDVRCSVDGAFLTASQSDSVDTSAETATSTPPPPHPENSAIETESTSGWTLTDHRTRIYEVALVCLTAFGGSILASTYYFSSRPLDKVASWHWINSGLHEGTSLALLWYVLKRRSWTFRDLGFSWLKRDFAVSIPLYLVGYIAFYCVYAAVYHAGWTSVGNTSAISNVAHHLFSKGVTVTTLLFQCLNPFYEELIVRAYLMTELRQLTNSVSKPIIVSTLLQMSYHFYQGAPMVLSDGAMFLVFSIYYSRTNRITPVILAHLYCDVGATLLYSVRHH